MQQERIRTIHVYFEEFEEDEFAEEEQATVDADPYPNNPEKTRFRALGICCGLFFSLLCAVIPILSTFLPQIYPNTYDTTISRTLPLTLAQHPTAGQIQVFSLAQIKKTESVPVTATGSIHQEAKEATGLLTFYNGLFSEQTVLAGTKFAGKDGIVVITSQNAVIPPATATTPPTYGTISVTAYSSISGVFGNIPTNDVDQACCGPSILVQNLYPFSGGQDAKDIPVLTKTDLSAGTQQVTSQVDGIVHDQAQQEIHPGYILLPLDCHPTLFANHQAGDHAASAIITLREICTPFAYFAADIANTAQKLFRIPSGYHLVSFSAYVAQSNPTSQGGTLIVQVIAYLKHNATTVSTYHFAGK